MALTCNIVMGTKMSVPESSFSGSDSIGRKSTTIYNHINKNEHNITKILQVTTAQQFVIGRRSTYFPNTTTMFTINITGHNGTSSTFSLPHERLLHLTQTDQQQQRWSTERPTRSKRGRYIKLKKHFSNCTTSATRMNYFTHNMGSFIDLRQAKEKKDSCGTWCNTSLRGTQKIKFQVSQWDLDETWFTLLGD